MLHDATTYYLYGTFLKHVVLLPGTSFYVVGRRVSQHHLFVVLQRAYTMLIGIIQTVGSGKMHLTHHEGLFLNNLPPPPAHYFKYNVKM